MAIRCAEIAEPAAAAAEPGSTLTLYSGAGIMPASRPDLELAETTAKFRTLLGAWHLVRSGRAGLTGTA